MLPWFAARALFTMVAFWATSAGGNTTGGRTQLAELDVEIAAIEKALSEKRHALQNHHEGPRQALGEKKRRALQGHEGPGMHQTGSDAHSRNSNHKSRSHKKHKCKAVVCDSHGNQDQHHDQQTEGCREYTVYNKVMQRSEKLSLTCEAPSHEHVSVDRCAASHHANDGLAWWPFMLCCLLVTVVVSGLLNKLGNMTIYGKSLNLPFTVVMFFFGYFAAAVFSSSNSGDHADYQEQTAFGVVSDSVASWKAAHPHVILFVLLPPLLFEDASSMDYYVFRKVLASSVLLAGPGVALSMLFTALLSMLLFGFADECVVETDHQSGVQSVAGAKEHTVDSNGVHICDPMINANWQAQKGPDGGLVCLECVEGSYSSSQLPVPIHLLLGGMLAATDPVAVCAVLNDLGCPDKLNYMIAGESLLNDGTAVVAFLVMQSVAGGCDITAAQVTVSLLRLAGGGVLWGLFMASCCYRALKYLRNPNIEITTVVFATLATFWIAENVIGVSGVLGTVVFGVQTARTSVLAMDEHTHHASHAFWSEVGYVATATIFILAGVKSEVKITALLDTFADDYIVDKALVCTEQLDEVSCLSHHACRWDEQDSANGGGHDSIRSDGSRGECTENTYVPVCL